MKLHLGCGENYLVGYINIDFPSSHHTVQKKQVADEYRNILKLNYPKKSVSEIRLHHVFEHFPRARALALLVCWREWLKAGGILHIESPDFERTAMMVLNPFASRKNKNVALRHIFGSQEADWATHYEGWSGIKLAGVLKSIGFSKFKIIKKSYKGTFNFELLAQKTIKKIKRTEYKSIVSLYLESYCLDNSETEKTIHSVWLKDFDDQLKECWPK